MVPERSDNRLHGFDANGGDNDRERAIGWGRRIAFNL